MMHNSKRFATPADPLLPLDVWTFDNSYVELLGDSPLHGQWVKNMCLLLLFVDVLAWLPF